MEHYIHLVVRNPTGSAECKASHTRAKGQVFDRSLPSECQPPSDMHPHTALDGIQLALLARTCTLPRSMIPIYQAALMLEGQKQRICCRDAVCERGGIKQAQDNLQHKKGNVGAIYRMAKRLRMLKCVRALALEASPPQVEHNTLAKYIAPRRWVPHPYSS